MYEHIAELRKTALLNRVILDEVAILPAAVSIKLTGLLIQASDAEKPFLFSDLAALTAHSNCQFRK